MHVLAAHPDPALRVVDLQLAEAQDAAARRHGGECCALDAAQQHMHACRELPHRERLGHVVVGADTEADEHVRLVVARREHQHGDRALGLDPAADLQAVEARQHDVEHHQIGLPGLGRVDGGRSVHGRLDEEALGPQAGGDGIDDRRVVLDDQHAALGAGCGRDAVVRGVCLLHGPAPVRVLASCMPV